MKATVRHFISPDVDLENFHPQDPADFSFLLQALVGPVDGPGEESLQFIVCTPLSIQKKLVTQSIVFGRSLVIVETWDAERILGGIRSSVERIVAPTWNAVANLLSRLGIYEFEDF